MQVVGGEKKGVKIRSLRGMALRPTATRVKEAFFDVLGPRAAGATMADFYAGTGSVGIEALSRGAKRVSFIENHLPSVKVLKTNLTASGLGHRAKVHTMDSVAYLRWAKRHFCVFDLLYVDPPYHGPLAEHFLRRLSSSGIVKAGGIVVIEHFHKQPLPAVSGHLKIDRCYSYGDTRLSLYHATYSVYHV